MKKIWIWAAVILLCFAVVIGILIGRKNNLQAEYDAFRRDAETQSAGLTEKLNALTAEKEGLDAAISEKDGTIAGLEAEKTSLTGQIEALAADKTALDTAVESLNADIAALEADKAALEADKAALEGEKETLSSEKGQLAADLDAQAAQLAELNGDIAALKEKPTRTAVLDVTWPEPPVPGSEFYTMDNVILTPHFAGSIGNEIARMGEYMLAEFLALRAGAPVKYEVTEPMLTTMA